MELWIRSQDKNVLENVKGFCIIHGSETCWTIVNVDTTTRYGTYKTKERALEVLDEIQEAMMLNEDYDYSGRAEVNTIRKCLIYEMPKD